MRKAREIKASEEKAEAVEMASRMQDQILAIEMKAGEGGKLFGSVTAADISTALSTQKNITLDRKAIEITESIKEIGSYPISVKPHPEVEFTISVNVVAESE